MKIVHILALCTLALYNLQQASAMSRLSPTMRAFHYFQLEHTQGTSCQPMKMSAAAQNFCHGYGYNTTTMPNLLNQNQDDAWEQMRGFDPLVQSSCNAELPFLLCSLYFPICATQSETSGEVARRPQDEVHMTTPCRSLCERVKSTCLPVLDRFGFGWPDDLNCTMLQDDRVSMGPNGETVVCFNRAPNAFTPNIPTESNCPNTPKCKTSPPKKKTYKSANFHFSISGTLIKTGMTGGYKSLYVSISKILYKCKQEIIPRPVSRQLRAGGTALLMSQGVDLCDCPHVGEGEHIFSGWVENEKLFIQSIDKRHIVMKATTARLSKKVKKWTKKYCPKI